MFTKHFETVLGGQDAGGRFRQFEELCCRAFLVLRRHVNLMLALFSLMVDCGIPELMTLADIAWMRNSLMPELSEEEAVERFMGLISESLENKKTRWNHAIHLIAKG